VLAQAAVTLGLVVIGALVVLALASVTYGVPSVVYEWQTAAAVVLGVACLLVLGVVIGLAVPSARAAQAVGLLAFFPLYLLGGGGPPRGVMTGPMQSLASALPSPIVAITDPWLGVERFSGQLVALGVWLVAGLVAAAWLSARRAAA